MQKVDQSTHARTQKHTEANTLQDWKSRLKHTEQNKNCLNGFCHRVRGIIHEALKSRLCQHVRFFQDYMSSHGYDSIIPWAAPAAETSVMSTSCPPTHPRWRLSCNIQQLLLYSLNRHHALTCQLLTMPYIYGIKEYFFKKYSLLLFWQELP